MKHFTKITSIELILIIISLFCLLTYSINYYVYIASLFVLSIFLFFILKPERRVERFNTDIFLIIVISLLFYYAFSYFIGFFSGFYYSMYSRKIIGILFNIVTGTIIVYSIETIRWVLIKNNFYHKSIVWITPIICFLLEIPSLVNLKLYNTRFDLFSVILVTLFPAFIKNILLTYITYKSDRKNSIIYQLLILIPGYLLPVIPNLGEFFTIIINVTIPVVILVLIMNISTIKFGHIYNSRKLANNRVILTGLNSFVLILIVTMIYLTSNLFRFTSLAIGSASMTGTINKGDIVILDKKDKNINKNSIIAFREQGKIIVHRVISFKEKDNMNFYQTKGDANKSKDGWLVSNESVVGKVKFRIRWVGWPTVALSELLAEKK